MPPNYAVIIASILCPTFVGFVAGFLIGRASKSLGKKHWDE